MSVYTELLTEMITLLEEAQEHHWEKWFKKSLEMALNGDIKESCQQTLRAYGGMGSFNDVYWHLPSDKFKQLEHIKEQLWHIAKDK